MITRRRLIQSSAAFTALGPELLQAQGRNPIILKLQRRILEINGKAASAYAIRQPNGQEGLTMDFGEPFNVRVVNELNEPSLIHWHGLTPPSRQDGVPGLSGPAIPAGAVADYNFPQTFGGTYWMHSHYGLQEQQLLTAPLIIRYANKYRDYQEAVVMLADFSFTTPQEIYASLTKNRSRILADKNSKTDPHMEMSMDHNQMIMDHDTPNESHMSMGSAASMDPDGMDMDEANGAHAMADLNDVAYDAFLANNRTLSDPDVITVERGGRILMRLINGASMSNFHVNLGEIEGVLVAVDGQEILPVRSRLFPIATGQRLDILLELPKQAVVSPVFFQLEGDRKRTGVVFAAPDARIEKYSETAIDIAPALNMELEGLLQAAWPLTSRPADRRYKLDLTGDMASYIWSINNIVWNESTLPLTVSSGERVELELTNRTVMAHPMHLHGHRFQVVGIDNRRFSGAVRDTIHIPPGKRAIVAFDADNPGHWAFHCHLAYHMHAGMFATFNYS
jgi:FtsP/CotA-like multicopper oxidase with cupredoxin domain